MLPEWRLAVVLETTDSEAKLGVLGPRPGGARRGAADAARPISAGRGRCSVPAGALAPPPGASLGPAPRRMADVVQAGRRGDGGARAGRAGAGQPAARPERLLLRQIPLVQGALVSLDPATGRVLAMSGGWSFEMSASSTAPPRPTASPAPASSRSSI